VGFDSAPGASQVGSQSIPVWLRVGPGSALVGSGGLWVDSGRMPVDFRVGSGWVLGRLRVGPGSAPGEFQVGVKDRLRVSYGAVPGEFRGGLGRFRFGSRWVPGRLRVVPGSSESTPGGCRLVSESAPDGFRLTPFRGTPARLRASAAVGSGWVPVRLRVSYGWVPG
jgi:hypothetical protein